MRFLSILLLITVFLENTAAYAGDKKTECAGHLLIVQEWSTMNSVQKMNFLEKNKNNPDISGVMKGAQILRGTFDDSWALEHRRICPTCKEFVDRAAKKLLEITPEIRDFDFTSNFSKNVRQRLPLASVLVAPDGTPLGAYVYLVREFYWPAGDIPLIIQNNWVDGYFDGSLTFIGRGSSEDSGLAWEKYGMNNKRDF